MANLEGESGELQATWVNASHEESGLPWQSFVPESKIDTIEEDNPELAELLRRQLTMRREMGRFSMFPVVTSDGEILTVTYIRRRPTVVEAGSL